MSKKVAVVMGSDSDLDTMRACMKRLKAFGVPFEVHVISAHRTPAAAEQFASSAREKGFGVIIAAAGKAAHLAYMKFGIVVAEWNREITEALLEGAVQTLRSAGCSDLNIQIKMCIRDRFYSGPRDAARERRRRGSKRNTESITYRPAT